MRREPLCFARTIPALRDGCIVFCCGGEAFWGPRSLRFAVMLVTELTIIEMFVVLSPNSRVLFLSRLPSISAGVLADMPTGRALRSKGSVTASDVIRVRGQKQPATPL